LLIDPGLNHAQVPSISAPWAAPSPDGQHLAIYVWSLSANMWMMENF
jgi:hypothetical protein